MIGAVGVFASTWILLKSLDRPSDVVAEETTCFSFREIFIFQDLYSIYSVKGAPSLPYKSHVEVWQSERSFEALLLSPTEPQSHWVMTTILKIRLYKSMIENIVVEASNGSSTFFKINSFEKMLDLFHDNH